MIMIVIQTQIPVSPLRPAFVRRRKREEWHEFKLPHNLANETLS